MTDNIDHAALIAEADAVTFREIQANPSKAESLIERLSDALESLTASLSVSERSDATVTEVTAPATDDEREALADAYRESTGWTMAEGHAVADAFGAGFDAGRRSARTEPDNDEREALWEVADEYLEKNNIEDLNPPSLSETFADMVWAAGFRRSARVSVSRDELAENLRRIHFDGTGCGTTASTACSNCFGPSPMTAREVAEHLSTTFDIYPKADRKPADSSNGDDR